MDSAPDDLSAGQRKKAEVIMGLIKEADLYIFDEFGRARWMKRPFPLAFRRPVLSKNFIAEAFCDVTVEVSIILAGLGLWTYSR